MDLKRIARRRRRKLAHQKSAVRQRKCRFESLEDRRLLTVEATYALGPLEVNNNIASVDVSLDFRATENEMLTFFSLDLAPSSANLIAAGPDFSAFSFEAATPLLDDWTQIGFLNDPGFESSVEYDDSLVAALPADNYTLGTLRVDLAAANLSPADAFTISIEGLDSVIGVVDAAQDFSFAPVTFAPGSREQFPVTVSGPATVDEGAEFILNIDTDITSAASFVIDWGDGQQQTVNTNDLPPSGDVSHIFSDGDTTSTIRVDLQTAGTTTVGELNVAVSNVAPTVQLGGPDFAAEGTAYSLLLESVTDPGDDTVTEYLIDWGDGTQQTVSATQLPATRIVDHTYDDDRASVEIVVGLVDEDGTFPEAGRLTIGVDNVSPTIPVSSPSEIDEGSTLTLSLGDVVDPGDDTVTRYVIDWGDGQQDVLNAIPANREITHTYTDGGLTAAIEITVDDEDGRHNAAGVTVQVNNVAPSVELMGETSGNINDPYRLSIGEVVDPGDDTISAYIVDWGDGSVDDIPVEDLPPDRSVSHIYRAGGGPATISVTLVDEDGEHQAAGELEVFVVDEPPEITLSGPPTVDEGAEYFLELGDITGPRRLQVVGVLIDWGDGEQDQVAADQISAGEQFGHTYEDGPADRQIRVRLTDTDGEVLNEITKPVSVLSVAPTIERFVTSASVPGETRPGEVVTATLDFLDPGLLDTHTATIDWDDGRGPVDATVNETGGAGSVEATNVFDQGGVYPLTVELTDDAGDSVVRQTTAYISGIRQANGVVQVVGSEENDIITVSREGTSKFFVNLTIPSLGNFRRSFDLAGVSAVDIYVGAGNDRVMVSQRLDFETYIDGGPDNDHLQGGDGPNTILGGPGRDRILGGDRRDILAGGSEQDMIFGYGDDDLLIGGSTDDLARNNTEPIEVWRSNNDASARESQIAGIIQVNQDESADTIFGGPGTNVFLVSDEDVFEQGGSEVRYSLDDAMSRGWAIPHPASSDVYSVLVNRQALQAGGEGADSEGKGTDYLPADTNQDGYISPMDAVVVINQLNRVGAGKLEAGSYYDVDGDGWLAPSDVLQVVNAINSQAAIRAGEGGQLLRGQNSQLPADRASSDDAEDVELDLTVEAQVRFDSELELSVHAIAVERSHLDCSAELECLFESLERKID